MKSIKIFIYVLHICVLGKYDAIFTPANAKRLSAYQHHPILFNPIEIQLGLSVLSKDHVRRIVKRDLLGGILSDLEEPVVRTVKKTVKAASPRKIVSSLVNPANRKGVQSRSLVKYNPRKNENSKLICRRRTVSIKKRPQTAGQIFYEGTFKGFSPILGIGQENLGDQISGAFGQGKVSDDTSILDPVFKTLLPDIAGTLGGKVIDDLANILQPLGLNDTVLKPLASILGPTVGLVVGGRLYETRILLDPVKGVLKGLQLQRLIGMEGSKPTRRNKKRKLVYGSREYVECIHEIYINTGKNYQQYGEGEANEIVDLREWLTRQGRRKNKTSEFDKPTTPNSVDLSTTRKTVDVCDHKDKIPISDRKYLQLFFSTTFSNNQITSSTTSSPYLKVTSNFLVPNASINILQPNNSINQDISNAKSDLVSSPSLHSLPQPNSSKHQILLNVSNNYTLPIAGYSQLLSPHDPNTPVLPNSTFEPQLVLNRTSKEIMQFRNGRNIQLLLSASDLNMANDSLPNEINTQFLLSEVSKSVPRSSKDNAPAKHFFTTEPSSQLLPNILNSQILPNAIANKTFLIASHYQFLPNDSNNHPTLNDTNIQQILNGTNDHVILNDTTNQLLNDSRNQPHLIGTSDQLILNDTSNQIILNDTSKQIILNDTSNQHIHCQMLPNDAGGRFIPCQFPKLIPNNHVMPNLTINQLLLSSLNNESQRNGNTSQQLQNIQLLPYSSTINDLMLNGTLSQFPNKTNERHLSDLIINQLLPNNSSSSSKLLLVKNAVPGTNSSNLVPVVLTGTSIVGKQIVALLPGTMIKLPSVSIDIPISSPVFRFEASIGTDAEFREQSTVEEVVPPVKFLPKEIFPTSQINSNPNGSNSAENVEPPENLSLNYDYGSSEELNVYRKKLIIPISKLIKTQKPIMTSTTEKNKPNISVVTTPSYRIRENKGEQISVLPERKGETLDTTLAPERKVSTLVVPQQENKNNTPNVANAVVIILRPGANKTEDSVPVIAVLSNQKNNGLLGGLIDSIDNVATAVTGLNLNLGGAKPADIPSTAEATHRQEENKNNDDISKLGNNSNKNSGFLRSLVNTVATGLEINLGGTKNLNVPTIVEKRSRQEKNEAVNNNNYDVTFNKNNSRFLGTLVNTTATAATDLDLNLKRNSNNIPTRAVSPSKQERTDFEINGKTPLILPVQKSSGLLGLVSDTTDAIDKVPRDEKNTYNIPPVVINPSNQEGVSNKIHNKPLSPSPKNNGLLGILYDTVNTVANAAAGVLNLRNEKNTINNPAAIITPTNHGKIGIGFDTAPAAALSKQNDNGILGGLLGTVGKVAKATTGILTRSQLQLQNEEQVENQEIDLKQGNYTEETDFELVESSESGTKISDSGSRSTNAETIFIPLPAENKVIFKKRNRSLFLNNNVKQNDAKLKTR